MKAPFDGTVVTRVAEPGEVITAGTPVITLLDLSKVYLRGFIPEGEIGKVKVGQAAHVYLDSNPTQPVDAYVSRIDPQATFTPENTYFRDDRVKQVVGVKLQLKGALGYRQTGHAVGWRDSGCGRSLARRKAQMTIATSTPMISRSGSEAAETIAIRITGLWKRYGTTRSRARNQF